MENLKIYCSTYNVGTASPDADFSELLSLKDVKNEKLPDIYVLSFQEVKSQPHNFLLNALFEEPWTCKFREILKIRGYLKIKDIKLQGLLMLVFALKKHLFNIREVEADYTRTGLAGMWGNKGAVSIRLSINGCSLCFVNSHLAAHDDQVKERIEDYNSIVKDQKFHVAETQNIFFHDYVFWMGDLNFRLDEAYEKSPEEIELAIVKNNLKELFEKDQLRQVMKKGEAFSELTEEDPQFPPTYKFEQGQNNYDTKRRPAWCDRILYCVNAKNYENVTLQLEQNSYKCHRDYMLSDHRPVTADFTIKLPHEKLLTDYRPQVFTDFGQEVIKFNHIDQWTEEENRIIFWATQDFPTSSKDWIGLFPEDFSALDQYVSWIFVSSASSPIEDQNSKKKLYEAVFDEVPNRCTGKYCLIYFNETEDKVSSVLGISNVFSIVKDEVD